MRTRIVIQRGSLILFGMEDFNNQANDAERTLQKASLKFQPMLPFDSLHFNRLTSGLPVQFLVKLLFHEYRY